MEVEPSDEDRKLPAVMPPPDSTDADELWKNVPGTFPLANLPMGFEILPFSRRKTILPTLGPLLASRDSIGSSRSFRHLFQTTRLSSIWIRFDEETPQYLRALITAPLGTPYSGGMFCFDIFVPNDYPNGPPSVILLTTGRS